MHRFAEIFARARKQNRCAMVPFITAGDPSLEATVAIARALEAAGADIIELGVPFSDPVADGPVIQRSSERALRRGVTLDDTLTAAARIRESTRLGVLLFGYINPVLRYGLEAFARRAAELGVDGVLATDLIPEESAEYRRCLDAYGLAHVFLAAPTSSDERLRLIAEASTGFIYAVSRTGVTGARRVLPEGAGELVARIRMHTQLPVALGFGISTPEQVREVATFADGAAVGTALVDAIDRAVSSAASNSAASGAAPISGATGGAPINVVEVAANAAGQFLRSLRPHETDDEVANASHAPRAQRTVPL